MLWLCCDGDGINNEKKDQGVKDQGVGYGRVMIDFVCWLAESCTVRLHAYYRTYELLLTMVFTFRARAILTIDNVPEMFNPYYRPLIVVFHVVACKGS